MNSVNVSAVRVRRAMDSMLPPFMARLGNRIATNGSERANVDTGLMRASIGWELVDAGHGTRVYCHTRYALYVHEGTGPHAIRARRPGGFLRFRGRDGTYVYRRQVWHPGYRGNPFLRNALEEEVARL